MNDLIRAMFRNYIPYKVSPQEYDIILNANENPLNLFDTLPKNEQNDLVSQIQFNRYPESDNTALRETYANYIGRETDEVLAGVGSDEIIRMIADLFLENNDVVIANIPTFSMYQTITEFSKGLFIGIPSKDDTFAPDIDQLISVANQYHAKVIFICTPNNPTGYLWKKEDLIKVIDSTTGMVVIDEAYIDFADENNLSLIDYSKRVIVLRTLSKAFALAGARVGFAIADKETIGYLSMVKIPYNLNSYSQKVAQLVLENIHMVELQIAVLKHQRDLLVNALQKFNEKIKIYPSSANFILISTKYLEQIKSAAEAHKVSLRYMGNEIPDAIRISVGTPEENEALIKIFTEVLS